MDENTPVFEITRSNRGGNVLLLNGYVYNEKRRNNKAIVWRCEYGMGGRSGSCAGALKTDLNMKVVLEGSEKPHNHLADVNRGLKRKVMNDISNQAVQTTGLAPIQVLSECRKSLPTSVDPIMPLDRSIVQNICRKRAKLVPHEPKTATELILDGDVRTYSDEDFLLYDNVEFLDGTDRRMVVFATNQNMEILAKSKHWIMDGTFKTCPRIFSQLYVIMGKVNDIYVPLIYSMMTYKDKRMYMELFHIISQRFAEMDLPNSLETVGIDFELSVSLASSQVFGNGVSVKYCFFHMMQTVCRWISTHGLKKKLLHSEGFKDELRFILSTVFLPPELIPDGFEIAYDTLSADVLPVADYFRRTFVGSEGRKAKFEPRQWSLYERILEGNPRSNNWVEGFNNKLSHLISSRNPKFFHVLEKLKQEQRSTQCRIIQSRTRKMSTVSSESARRQEELKSLVTEFDDLSLTEFMTKASFFVLLTGCQLDEGDETSDVEDDRCQENYCCIPCM